MTAIPDQPVPRPTGHLPANEDLPREPLLIVGLPGPTHVGRHFKHAAASLGLRAEICDSSAAFSGPMPLRKINWLLRGHRPLNLGPFQDHVLAKCQEIRPRWLLATGIAPLQESTLRAMGEMGICRINFLTDDPWNPSHRADWFLKGLPAYDVVCTPRRAVVSDLLQVGCKEVEYVPFAYAPEIHFPQAPPDSEASSYQCDMFFAGGADADRLPWMIAATRSGFDVKLYGAYWERIRALQGNARGYADERTLRYSSAIARVGLCLVRKANRDGHVMRTYELAAMGACMLAEDTSDHRALFGGEGNAVLYFSSVSEMLEKLRWLIEHADARAELAQAALRIVTQGRNTYGDRLVSMLTAIEDRLG